MTTADLDAADLDWKEHNISGSEKPARMVMLHASAERNTRTVMVEFPPSWKRDAVGHQPAGEEMVILSGALSISGATAAAGASCSSSRARPGRRPRSRTAPARWCGSPDPAAAGPTARTSTPARSAPRPSTPA